MELRPQKRICSSKNGRDRFSELPDDVIVRILSCLPTVDAVRTVLLRRFGNLWTLIHTLNFDYDDYIDNFCNCKSNVKRIRWFCCFVRNALMRQQNLSIHSFHLSIAFNYQDERNKAGDDIKEWLRFALDRQVKEIRLSDNSEYQLGCSSILPNMFTSQFLVTLHLHSCGFKGEFQVKLGSLKKLSLKYVTLTDENFRRFISGCPSLQDLLIKYPIWMKKLSFSAPKIEKLYLARSYGGSRFSLNSPNLKSLNLKFVDWRIDIIDVSSVRDIYIKYERCFMNEDDVLALNQMLEKFEGIEVFRLSCNTSKHFLRIIQKLELLQSRWKRVVLELDDFCGSCLLGMYHLMRSLKHLEELIIHTTEDFKATADLLNIELSSPCVTPQLKTITLHGYGKSWKSQLQLIEFLLKSAAVLEKLVIVSICRLKETDELEFVKHVSSFPRTSTAKVIFA
ncbi:F-box/LRR-repeat protein At1g55660-like [Silene latifolia]|uniref:F-box/LRR-repeat protein At1g55660-like n=1 Tax=Silene latifolia TaxID=37657 RepID=UPI003D77485F